MKEKAMLKRRLYELDFAIYELILFSDSHPDCRKALELMGEYRKKREETAAEYREKFGELIITAADAPTDCRWKWIDDPWPWENNFTEA